MYEGNIHEIGFTSLFYASRSSIENDSVEAEVEQIVSVARSRNAALNVTGALLFTGVHFAQILEGPRLAIRELMTSIEADRRHRDVTVLTAKLVRSRDFPDWAMAYSGRSIYLDRHIKPLLSHGTDQAEVNTLIDRLTGMFHSMSCG